MRIRRRRLTAGEKAMAGQEAQSEKTKRRFEAIFSYRVPYALYLTPFIY